MADAQILRAARARIADPIHWTTKSYARNERGGSTYPQEASAVCWCAYGALRAGSTRWCSDEDEALRQAAFALYGTRSVADVNDHRGHAAVLAMYDAAIASAEASA